MEAFALFFILCLICAGLSAYSNVEFDKKISLIPKGTIGRRIPILRSRQSPGLMKIDHLVLTVWDIKNTVWFYCVILGMEKIIYGDDRVALVYGDQKINLHPFGSVIEPRASKPTPGSADLCFLTEKPVSKWASWLEDNEIEIIEGPVRRNGTTGPINSIYFRDPDGNLIELANLIDHNQTDTADETEMEEKAYRHPFT